MKWSKFRRVLVALVLVLLCGFVVVKIVENQWSDDSLDGQTQRLQSFWAVQRRAAATGLAQFPRESERLAPLLLKALRDSDREVRVNALQTLKSFGKLPDGSAVVLVDVLEHDQDSAIRQDAASLLGMTPGPIAATALVAAIDDPDPEVRLAALNSLVFHGTAAKAEPTIDKLMGVASSTQPEVLRVAAIQALASIGRDQERVARYFADLREKDRSALVRNDATLLMINTKFGFEITALIAALDDESPQVRLTAGSALGRMGLIDDRIVPALCQAARKADDVTREGMGISIGKLRWDPPAPTLPVEAANRRYLTAARELISLLDPKAFGARSDVVTVLGRLTISYQQSPHPVLLEPAKEALQAVLARILDEKEETPIRLFAMSQWTLIQPTLYLPTRPRRGSADSAVPQDQLHARGAWLTTLATALASQSEPIRNRALEMLVDGAKDSQADDWYRDAWRKIVPIIAKSTAGDDGRVRAGAVLILGMLGPEAAEAADTLKTLARDTKEPALRAAAEQAIASVTSADRLRDKDAKVRMAAAESLRNLGWRATQALPALSGALKDPDAKVRLAAINSLRSLGSAGATTVTELSSALAGETDPEVKIAILAALEAIAPGSPVVLDAHLRALRDSDASVRKAAATFQKVPLDDSLVSALGTALADSRDDVRSAAAISLTAILFENPAVVPTLVNALRDQKQRTAVNEALDKDYERDPDSRGLNHFRNGIPGLQAAVTVAIPALRDALALKDKEITPNLCVLLGRIVSFPAKSRSDDLHKSVEPALPIYLQGLDDSDPFVRQEVLSRLDSIPIRRAEIVAALIKFLERSDRPTEERTTAFAALAAQAALADSNAELRKSLEPAVPTLTKALDAPEPEIRESAVLALGYLGTSASSTEEKLQSLANNDPRPSVRKKAENAIKAIKGNAKMRRPS